MKKNILFFLLLTSGSLFAQDKTLQATAYYNKAEAAYNNRNFNESVNYLNQAENILGGPNPKTLYLKIQALNELTKSSSDKLSELKQALEKFYEIVNKDFYPTDKYLDITTIDLELREREQTIRENAKLEELAFQKAKSSDNLAYVTLFLNSYPNSKFIPQLSDRINALREQKEQVRIEEEKKALEAKKNAKPNGFYMGLGFALQTLQNLERPLGVNFMAKGGSFDLGFKIFYYKNLDKKFRVGFDLGLVSYSFALSNYYNYTQYDAFQDAYTPDNGRAVLHTIQFLKIGPTFSLDLKKSQHFLYITPQVGGNFSIYNIPGKYGSHTQSTGVMGMGVTGCFKVEYLYRKLLIGIKYQYNLTIDLNDKQMLGGHQIVVPTIGVKF